MLNKILENATIVDQEEVALRTFRLRLAAPEIARRAQAGQFVMLQVRQGLDPLLKRPFSFHRILREEGIVEILYRVVGRGTWLLSRSTPGSSLELIGPLGNGFRLHEGISSCIVLIAGGIGIAPLHELTVQLIRSLQAEKHYDIHLFYGARSAEELIPTDHYQDLGVQVHISTDDGSRAYMGRVTSLFEEHMASYINKPALIFSCGPLIMQYHVARWALVHNVNAQLSLESLMACGIGACLGCALPSNHPTDSYLHVCKDGPIFLPGSIAWNKIQFHQTTPPTFLFS